MSPGISVVISSDESTNLSDIHDCLQGLTSQSPPPEEIIVVATNNKELYNEVEEYESVTGIIDTEGLGLAEARNLGAEEASEDVVAFIDDDVIPSETWCEELKNTFAEGTVMAGGPAYPDWDFKRPPWFHKKVDWIVGAGPYNEDGAEILNTYGCNIAYDAEVFEEFGGFDERFGWGGDFDVQGEEAELCSRISSELDEFTVYKRDISVWHKANSDITPSEALGRAYQQGETKAYLNEKIPNRESKEEDVLKDYLMMIVSLLLKHKRWTFVQAIFLSVVIISVVSGYFKTKVTLMASLN